ncbi:MAG TPA: plastocyanin/azurin family copper-binding protein [Acidimicrobiia bacterium]|nr:plastocyanin/azurin family copper-binding protein [Acidimicrobiia bacterium]
MERGRVARLLTIVVATAAIATACGGGGGGGSSSYKQPKGPAQTTLDIKGGNFFFDPKNPDAPAGVDAIKLTSEGGLHTLVFAGDKVPHFKLQASSGNSDELRVDLKPGTYEFFCDIPGHREAGMDGTLTVR